MHEVVTELRLWDLDRNPFMIERGFLPRGYDVDGTSLPAELAAAATDEAGVFHPLSIEKVASHYCPTRRDLYLELKEGKKGEQSWGRVAGHLIQTYLEELVEACLREKINLADADYRALDRFAEDYSSQFWTRETNREARLRLLADEAVDDPVWLRYRLRQTAAYQGAMMELRDRLPLIRRGFAPQLLATLRGRPHSDQREGFLFGKNAAIRYAK